MNDRRRDDSTLKEIKTQLHELTAKVSKTSDLGIRIEVNVKNIHDYIASCQDDKDEFYKRLAIGDLERTSIKTNQKITNYILGSTVVAIVVKFVTGLLFAAKKM